MIFQSNLDIRFRFIIICLDRTHMEGSFIGTAADTCSSLRPSYSQADIPQTLVTRDTSIVHVFIAVENNSRIRLSSKRASLHSFYVTFFKLHSDVFSASCACPRSLLCMGVFLLEAGCDMVHGSAGGGFGVVIFYMMALLTSCILCCS